MNLYEIGGAALLIRALNFSVSKDNFWTTGPTQPGRVDLHPLPEAHTMVAVLGCGPFSLTRPTRPTFVPLISWRTPYPMVFVGLQDPWASAMQSDTPT